MATDSAGLTWRGTRAFAVRAGREHARGWTGLVGAAVPVALFGLLLFAPGFADSPPARAAAAVAAAAYGAFLAPTYAAASVLSGDLAEGRYRKLRSMPVAPSADAAGRVLAALAPGLVGAAIALAVGALAGGRYAVAPGGAALVVVALVAVAVLGGSLGVVFAALLARGAALAASWLVPVALFAASGYGGTRPDAAVEGALVAVPPTLAARVGGAHLTDATSLVPPALPEGPLPVAALVALALLGVALAATTLGSWAYGGGAR